MRIPFIGNNFRKDTFTDAAVLTMLHDLFNPNDAEYEEWLTNPHNALGAYGIINGYVYNGLGQRAFDVLLSTYPLVADVVSSCNYRHDRALFIRFGAIPAYEDGLFFCNRMPLRWPGWIERLYNVAMKDARNFDMATKIYNVFDQLYCFTYKEKTINTKELSRWFEHEVYRLTSGMWRGKMKQLNAELCPLEHRPALTKVGLIKAYS